jgi:hypothetical protein
MRESTASKISITDGSKAALTDSAMLLRIAELGDTPLSLTTSEFAKLIVDETEKWSKVIRAANIRAE